MAQVKISCNIWLTGFLWPLDEFAFSRSSYYICPLPRKNDTRYNILIKQPCTLEQSPPNTSTCYNTRESHEQPAKAAH